MKTVFLYTRLIRTPLLMLLLGIILSLSFTPLHTKPTLKSQVPNQVETQQSNDKDKPSPTTKISEVWGAALHYYETQDYLSALSSFQILHQKFPDNEKILFNLGLTYYQLHLIYPESQLSYLAHAVKSFKQAFVKNPSYTPAHDNLIFIQLQIFLSEPTAPPYHFLHDIYERAGEATFLARETASETLKNTPKNTLKRISISSLSLLLKQHLLQNPDNQNFLLKIITFMLMVLSLLLVLKLKAKHSPAKKQLNILLIIGSVFYGLTVLIFLSILVLKSIQPPATKEGIVQSKELPVYRDATADSEVLTRLQEGTLVTLEIEREKWVQVSLSHTFKDWAERQIHEAANSKITSSTTSPTTSPFAKEGVFRGWIPAASVLFLE